MTGPRRIAVVGPGSLGTSLAGWAAERGLEVLLVGRDRDHARAGLGRVEAAWARRAAQGRLEAAALDAARGRLEARGLAEPGLETADVVFEALPEDLAAKGRLWAALAPRVAPDALLLTGTSSLPAAEVGRAAGLPGRILAFHLFVPVARMGIVELAVPEDAAPALEARARALAEALDKPVARVRDGAGFAASRMALAQGLEAMRLLEEGAASAEDLDALMVHGYGHPVGPLELSDRIGLDLRLRIAEALHAATGDRRYEPPALLRQKVENGEWGLKRGRGFYTWEGGRRR